MISKYITIFMLLCLFVVPTTSSANANSCYSATEVEAEQGIRIHSELMVIGLNCQVMGQRAGLNLYGDYRRFTADHADLFAKYEKIMLAYFNKNGGGKPEAQLNTLRTNFANKISNQVADMRPDVFCSRYAPRIVKASKMSMIDVRKWASTIHESHPVSKPRCKARRG